MEVKTMVLDEIEYVLIPKDVFDKSVGIEVQTQPELKKEDLVTKPMAPLPPVEVTKPVVVVSTMPDVKKAQGKTYGFGERLKRKALIPEDVMVVRTSFEAMPEAPEIAKNDFRDKSSAGLQKAKFGFYGPGAERDVG